MLQTATATATATASMHSSLTVAGCEPDMATRLTSLKSDLNGDEVRLRKAALKRRCDAVRVFDVFSHPAVQVAMVPFIKPLKATGPIWNCLTAFERVRQTSLGNLMTTQVVYSKLQSIINIVQDLHDRISGAAGNALSQHHLNLFFERLEHSTSLMQKVTADLDAFADTGGFKRAWFADSFQRDLKDLDQCVDEMLQDLHAHTSVASIAIQRRVTRETSEASKVAAPNFNALERQADKTARALALLEQHQASQKQQLQLILEIQAAVKELQIVSPFLKDIANPQIAALWKHIVPQGASHLLDLEMFEASLPGAIDQLYAEFFASNAEARTAACLAIERFISHHSDAVSMDDLECVSRMAGSSRSARVSVLRLDKAFPLPSRPTNGPQADFDANLDPATLLLPDWLVWKYAGWVVFAETKCATLRRLASDLTIGRSAADKAIELAETTVSRLLEHLGLTGPRGETTLDYARVIAPKFGWAAAGKPPARFQKFLDALDLPAKAVSEALAMARGNDWSEEGEADALSEVAIKFSTSFPAALANAQASLLAAAKKLGLGVLSEDAVKGLKFGPKALAAASADAVAAMSNQKRVLELIDTAAAEHTEGLFSQVFFDWSDVELANGSGRSPWGHALLFGAEDVELLECPADRAEAVLSTLTIASMPSVTFSHSRRVYGVLPPSGATGGSWGIVAERVLPDLRLDDLPLVDRVQALFDLSNGLAELHGALYLMQSELLPVGLAADRVVFTRNPGLGYAQAKLPIAGLDGDSQPLPLLEKMQADMLALAKLIRDHVVTDEISERDLDDDPTNDTPIHPLRVLVESIEKASLVPTGDGDDALSIANTVNVLELVLGKLRTTVGAAASDLSGQELDMITDVTTHSATIIDATQLETFKRAVGEQSGFLSHDQATFLYHSALRPIQISRTPFDQPDYDVREVVLKLLRAGASGSVPMALVAAADLYYYGAVARVPAVDLAESESWDIAWHLYAMAAEQGCDYACAGLGDLLFFQLGKESRGWPDAVAAAKAVKGKPKLTVQEQLALREKQLDEALRLYERAYADTTHPGRAVLFDPQQLARVHGGRADVHFARAELILERAKLVRDGAKRKEMSEAEREFNLRVADADMFRKRALADYKVALDHCPNHKRSITRLALYSLHGLAGVQKSINLARQRLSLGRSRANGRRELEARIALSKLMSDADGIAAATKELEAYLIPDH
ncbi:hypothetical protein H9P43_008983 [Blastocladiella emersonii ATCC 22665]|nr:hypothetical protein H9P43_008983 [Blastocladiella emersonii ATCC 22665]